MVITIPLTIKNGLPSDSIEAARTVVYSIDYAFAIFAFIHFIKKTKLGYYLNLAYLVVGLVAAGIILVIKATDPLIWDFGRYFRELSIEKLSLYPEARAMLLAIRAAGKRVWLLSNAQRVFTGPEHQKLGIDDCFNGIYISSDYDCKKPDPRFFNILLKEQGIDPAHAIMIGNDGNCDIAGARQVGLHTLYLHSETSPKGDDPVADYKLSEPDMKMVKKILLEENGLR